MRQHRIISKEAFVGNSLTGILAIFVLLKLSPANDMPPLHPSFTCAGQRSSMDQESASLMTRAFPLIRRIVLGLSRPRPRRPSALWGRCTQKFVQKTQMTVREPLLSPGHDSLVTHGKKPWREARGKQRSTPPYHMEQKETPHLHQKPALGTSAFGVDRYRELPMR